MNQARRRNATLTVILAYLCGVVAAASVGRIGPVAVAVQNDLNLNLSGFGWLVSAVDGVGAVVGMAAGLLVARYGAWWVLSAGLVLNAAAVVSSAFATGFGGVIATRFVEGAGYLVVSTAIPSLISAVTTGRRRIVALSVWATYVPVGLAIGAFGGGVLSELLGWRGWFVVVGVTLGVLAVVTWPVGLRFTSDRTRGGSGDSGVMSGLRHALFGRPLLVALGFCLVVALNLTVISLFPAYLAGRVGLSPAATGTLVGLLTLLAVPGGVLTGWLSERMLSARRSVAAGLLMPIGVALAFTDVGVTGNAVGFGLFVFANGMLVAAVFAAVPSVARTPAVLSVTYGLMAQTASLATFLLVPALAALITATFWWSAAPAVLVITLVALGLLRTVLPSGAAERSASGSAEHAPTATPG